MGQADSRILKEFRTRLFHKKTFRLSLVFRETHKRGGFIRAGADLVIPDYSQMGRLLAVLGVRDC